MTAAQQNGGPTVRRLQLGARLRSSRIAAGVTREQAGYAIRGSESKISRMELGRVSFKERDVVDLLKLYGVHDPAEHSRLVALAREANEPGWWHAYGDILTTWFQNYLDLEQAAELIRTYEVQFVPGLLQTDAYARAVIMLGHATAKAEEVLREQIEALLEACRQPTVRLQVMPFRSGGHAAMGGAFSILRFPEQELPDVVYIEHLTSALYLDKLEDLDQYTATMEALCVAAPPPSKTRDKLASILHDYT
jgi:hypothetical protein